MESKPEKIASQWRRQMQRGYLKLTILYALTKIPLHGYNIIKHIREWTLGTIIPTAGGLYPTLKDLEIKGLIKGKWSEEPEERKKVYQITKKGRAVLEEAVEKHFKLVSSISRLFLTDLMDLRILEKTDLHILIEPVTKTLCQWKSSTNEEKIYALEQLKERLDDISLLIPKMKENIENIKKEIKK